MFVSAPRDRVQVYRYRMNGLIGRDQIEQSVVVEIGRGDGDRIGARLIIDFTGKLARAIAVERRVAVLVGQNYRHVETGGAAEVPQFQAVRHVPR